MSTAGGIFFILCSVIAVAAAIGTVLFRNPLRCAVSLLLHIISLAGLYLTLHAQLLAAIQLIVYAGAVVVLFIFVIMLIGPTTSSPGHFRGVMLRTFGAAVLSLLVAAVASSLAEHTAPHPYIAPCAKGEVECRQFGGVEGVGTVLFRDALLPFELVSLLLLVAIIGAIAVARGKNAREKERDKATRLRKQGALAVQGVIATGDLGTDAAHPSPANH